MVLKTDRLPDQTQAWDVQQCLAWSRLDICALRSESLSIRFSSNDVIGVSYLVPALLSVRTTPIVIADCSLTLAVIFIIRTWAIWNFRKSVIVVLLMMWATLFALELSYLGPYARAVEGTSRLSLLIARSRIDRTGTAHTGQKFLDGCIMVTSSSDTSILSALPVVAQGACFHIQVVAVAGSVAQPTGVQ